MKDLINFNRNDYPFELFSLSHVSMILITIGLLIAMYHWRDVLKTRLKWYSKYILIITLVFGEILYHLWFLYHGRWDLDSNLPLQLSSISLYLCAIMLLTKSYKIFEVSFFVSMTGAFIAILTPELFFGFPHMRFFHFFIVHIAIILACFYMVWIEGYQATRKSVVKAFIVLNIFAAFVYIVNQMIGSNYMFLARKPANATIIDFLGPYPWYIIGLEVIALTLFVFLYIAFFKNSKDTDER
ncbi:putative integral membrane protein (TIGR02206 family) [Natronobacillus azotifigens]|uniref:TIGR02206 family membrane protein n=1 Tax=Natronobacillus azotifigens TaxID=472978 RepID=A0A9J6RG52_9BACI|nr:TIGR02206 family membrane protein [Natronobacillus azotifigens]MCZ0704543.1 TIGR02206 family membrane protein [Natronobacillus azotifigens]